MAPIQTGQNPLVRLYVLGDRSAELTTRPWKEPPSPFAAYVTVHCVRDGGKLCSRLHLSLMGGAQPEANAAPADGPAPDAAAAAQANETSAEETAPNTAEEPAAESTEAAATEEKAETATPEPAAAPAPAPAKKDEKKPAAAGKKVRISVLLVSAYCSHQSHRARRRLLRPLPLLLRLPQPRPRHLPQMRLLRLLLKRLRLRPCRQ